MYRLCYIAVEEESLCHQAGDTCTMFLNTMNAVYNYGFSNVLDKAATSYVCCTFWQLRIEVFSKYVWVVESLHVNKVLFKLRGALEMVLLSYRHMNINQYCVCLCLQGYDKGTRLEYIAKSWRWLPRTCTVPRHSLCGGICNRATFKGHVANRWWRGFGVRDHLCWSTQSIAERNCCSQGLGEGTGILVALSDAICNKHRCERDRGVWYHSVYAVHQAWV